MWERLKRSKFWGMIVGDGTGIGLVQQGIGMGGDTVVQVTTIIAGAVLILGSTIAYIKVQGDIDAIVEEGKYILQGLWEDENNEEG